jgi:hypothetical protein
MLRGGGSNDANEDVVIASSPSAVQCLALLLTTTLTTTCASTRRPPVNIRFRGMLVPCAPGRDLPPLPGAVDPLGWAAHARAAHGLPTAVEHHEDAVRTGADQGRGAAGGGFWPVCADTNARPIPARAGVGGRQSGVRRHVLLHGVQRQRLSLHEAAMAGARVHGGATRTATGGTDTREAACV